MQSNFPLGNENDFENPWVRSCAVQVVQPERLAINCIQLRALTIRPSAQLDQCVKEDKVMLKKVRLLGLSEFNFFIIWESRKIIRNNNFYTIFIICLIYLYIVVVIVMQGGILKNRFSSVVQMSCDRLSFCFVC